MSAEKILIVEDEKIIALDLQRRLERFGYVVTETLSNGEDALASVSVNLPDLVLLDIMLSSKLDGIETARRMRDSYGLPVIFLTAYADDATLEKAKSAEPYGYLLKPFKERELYTTIDIALYKVSTEKRLRKQERLFSAILYSISDAIVATGIDMDILFMNPAAEKLLGVNEADAKGKPIGQIADIRFPGGADTLRSVADGLESGTSYVFRDAIVTNPQGEKHITEGIFTRIHEADNAVRGFILAVSDVTEMRSMTERLNYQASHDTLTGLSNRDEYSYKLGEILDSLKIMAAEHALVLMDIDRFKMVNDTAGSMAGDEVLKLIAGYISRLTQKHDFAARLGGDEYAIILRDCGIKDAVQVARRLQDAVTGTKFEWDRYSYPLSLSIGVVPLNQASGDIHQVQASADDACYMAREEGGNRINVFKPGETKFMQRRGEMEWIGKLSRAIETDRFSLHYQTIMPVDSASGLEPKLEILVRLRSEDGTFIRPGDFLPAAERYNMMPAIDRWVIASSMKSFRTLLDAGHELSKSVFSVNLSGPSILDEGTGAFIMSQVGKYSLDPSRFTFEITETQAMQNLSYASRFMTSLKRLGFTFALDDFGSGFSSFSYLKNLPVDYLKLDGSFVQNIHESKINRTMVEAFNAIGHVMGLKTVGEFVKSREVLESLKGIGVDYAQGYFLSEPQPLPL